MSNQMSGYVVIGSSHYMECLTEYGFFETLEDAKDSAEFSRLWCYDRWPDMRTHYRDPDNNNECVSGCGPKCPVVPRENPDSTAITFDIDRIIPVNIGVPFDMHPEYTAQHGPDQIGIIKPPYLFIYNGDKLELEYYDFSDRPDIPSPKGLLCSEAVKFTSKLEPAGAAVWQQLRDFFEQLTLNNIITCL